MTEKMPKQKGNNHPKCQECSFYILKLILELAKCEDKKRAEAIKLLEMLIDNGRNHTQKEAPGSPRVV